MEVVVIGAGVHGASAAMHLARGGDEVTVVERLGGAAEGPTGRSSAICRAYYTNPFLAEVARDSLEAFAAFEDFVQADLPCGYRRSGALYLHEAADRHEVETTRRMLAEVGTATSFLDLDDVLSLYDGFEPEGIGFGVWEPDAGQADPVATTTSMLTAARRVGARVRFGTEVARVVPDADRPSVELADGTTIAADRVLVAAGPWTRPLLATGDVDLPLTVERHLVTLHGWGPVRPLPFVLADLTTASYLTLEGPGQFGLGPLDAGPVVDVDRDPATVTDDEQVELVGRIAERIPAMTAVDLRGGWASVYDVSPDWQPVIGEVTDGVVVDAGTSGHGFKLAPVLGRHVAALVRGSSVDPRLAAFHPDRFTTATTLAAGFGRNPIIG